MAGTTLVQQLGGATTGITAYAGGGAANATVLTTKVNVVATCATAADSVKLPLAPQLSDVVVRNNGAASCNVFPPSGGAINGGSADAAFAVANGKTATFTVVSADGLTIVANLSA